MVSQLALVLKGQLLEPDDSSLTAPPTQYVTIAEERLLALREKQMELLGLVAATKSSCEYQVGVDCLCMCVRVCVSGGG